MRTTVSTNSLCHSRILLVSPLLHFPPESGANQRTYFLWKALSEIAPVDVVQVCHDLAFKSSKPAGSIPASMNFLGRFTWPPKAPSPYRSFKESRLSLTIEHLLHLALPKHWDYEVDRSVSRSISDVLDRQRYFLAVGRYLKPMVKTGLVGRVPCLLDIDDLDFDFFDQRAQDQTRSRWRRFLYSIQSSQIKAAFQKWLPRFNGLWVTKPDDTRHAYTRTAAILPNIPYNQPQAASPAGGPRSANPIILTVGVLYYQPNWDGIERFLSEGWPKVRAACPTAEYWLVGKNYPTIARRWQKVPGVKVLGYVEDLAPVYEASWFTLCPLWSGGGTNIKVLESLAFGRTCVATVRGHRGYENNLLPGDSLVVAATPEDLANNCIQLIDDPTRRLELARRGRQAVQREFSYEKFSAIVHREVERSLSGSGQSRLSSLTVADRRAAFVGKM
jgi:polysaccharide biosynthesis protein PslH